MSITMTYNPIQILVDTFQEMYPDKNASINWSIGIYEDSGRASNMILPSVDTSDMVPVIVLDGRAPVVECISELIHQFAHLAIADFSVPLEDEEDLHGPDWEDVSGKISQAYIARSYMIAKENGLIQQDHNLLN